MGYGGGHCPGYCQKLCQLLCCLFDVVKPRVAKVAEVAWFTEGWWPVIMVVA